VSRTLSVR